MGRFTDKSKRTQGRLKVTYDSCISTQCINDVDLLSDDNDKIQFLKLVKEGKVKPSDVKERVKELFKATDETRKNFLYRGQPLPSDINKLRMPKKTISSKTLFQNPNLMPEIYELLKTVQDHFALNKDDVKRKEDINYAKFCASLFLQILYKEGKIGKDFFESVVRNELGIDKDQLHHFYGLNTKGVSWWLSKTKKDDEIE